MKLVPTDIHHVKEFKSPSVSTQYEAKYVLENLVNDPFLRAISKAEQVTGEDLQHLKIAFYDAKIEYLKELVAQATSEFEEMLQGAIEGHPLADTILELAEIEKTKQL